MRFRMYVLDTNENHERVVLTSDEIKRCEIKLLPKISEHDANIPSRKEITIVGKIIGEITSDSVEKMDIYSNYNDIDTQWKENNDEVSAKTSKLLSEKFSGIPKLNDISEIYKGNRENIKGLRNWCLAHSDRDYRHIVIERITKNPSPELFYLENMYAYSFTENGDMDQGNGEFVLVLRQKLHSDNKDKYEG